MFFYSEIYPVSDHFFVLHTVDSSKTYSPESQIVIDIPTAVAFFGQRGRDDTLSKVHGMAVSLVSEWNKHFYADPNKVSYSFQSSIKKPQVIFSQKTQRLF